MTQLKPHEFSYSKIPMVSNNGNRDERFIIEVPGNWIPEVDIIFYGLLNSDKSDDFFKLNNITSIIPRNIYLDLCYFEAPDLIRYLKSRDDSLENISQSDIIEYTKVAIENYYYIPANESMFRHSIIEASYNDFIKEIVLLYPWDIREIDLEFINRIIPKKVIHKFTLLHANLLDLLKENASNGNDKFTSIICNDINDAIEMVNNQSLYGTSESFILLRNHSGNVKMSFNEDGKPIFEEIGNYEVLSKIIDLNTGYPTSKMRFARYEPILFADAKPKNEDFLFGE